MNERLRTRMIKLRYSVLAAIFSALLLFVAGCEQLDDPPEEEAPIEIPEVPEGNKLLKVIEEDNVWGEKVITGVDRVMSLLRTTKYTLGNYVTDVEGGRLEVDCSKYMETIMKAVSLTRYNELPKSSSSGLPPLQKIIITISSPSHLNPMGIIVGFVSIILKMPVRVMSSVISMKSR